MCYLSCVVSYLLYVVSYVLYFVIIVLCFVSYVLCFVSYVSYVVSYTLCVICCQLRAGRVPTFLKSFLFILECSVLVPFFSNVQFSFCSVPFHSVLSGRSFLRLDGTHKIKKFWVKIVFSHPIIKWGRGRWGQVIKSKKIF